MKNVGGQLSGRDSSTGQNWGKDTCRWILRGPAQECVQYQAKVRVSAWQWPETCIWVRTGATDATLGHVSESPWVTQPKSRLCGETWRWQFRLFLSNLIEIEVICLEEWRKLTKSRCAKLVKTCQKSLNYNCGPIFKSSLNFRVWFKAFWTKIVRMFLMALWVAVCKMAKKDSI